ncbi:hypothetical protein ME1_00206 [Bartonella vinsonii subsp. arupensis OK-94-513]|uniref:Uncharacterized protein n=2 Tax=Bartonella vinsonii subsp. arupensis TaxID=110578 RepID=J0QU75_BARVI|nr:hypothetical protein [Bartonella vinsonii]EJF89436.1 hypothetical protein ME1_00206 [Bartonella vinsonii subsp. arupensis OK-94-513]EJF98411.1 hypothetical protein MEI_00582 [Bartonella vinsonii subsp. arupensis Pm136co]
MTSLRDKELSDTLVGLYDDYQRGFDIGEQLKSCVDLALSLELELSICRLSEADMVFKKEIVETLRRRRMPLSNENEEETVTHMDFEEHK